MPRTTGLTLELNNTRMYEREMRNLDRIISDLDKKVDKAGGALDKLDHKLDKSAKSSKKMSRESKRSSDSVGRDFQKIERESRRMDSVGDRLERFGGKVSLMISAPAAAIKAFAVNEAMQFESAFAGVIKTLDTTGLSAEETELALGQMRDEIRALATDISAPVAGIANAHQELSRIAELGGQLGINREGLIGFTNTIGELTLATELTAEAAATAIAQFANVTGGSAFDRIGATIVALGNNSATTEDQILGFASRLGAAGAQAGFTQAEILGMGAAMASMGLNAEAGGTAMTRVLNTLGVSVATGNEDLQKFADTAGLSVGEFATLFEEDAAGALSTFITGMEDLSRTEQLNLMNSLGFADIRVQDTLSRLAGAPEILANSLSLANTAFEENTALTAEAEQRFATTASQMNLLQNNISDVAITIGDALLPGINNMVAKAVPFLQWINEANPALIQMAVSILGVAAAIGPMMLIGSQLSALLPILGTAFAVITGPIGLTVLAVGGLVAIFGDLDAIGSELHMMFSRFQTHGLVEGFQLLFTTFEDGSSHIGGLLQGFGLAEQTANNLANKINAIGDAFAMVRGVVNTFNFVNNGEAFGLEQERQQNQLLSERRVLLRGINLVQNNIAEGSGISLDHTIEQGDTLWDLARQYDTTVDELMRLNDMDSTSILSIGQELIIEEGAIPNDALADMNAELALIDAQLADLPEGVQGAFDSFAGSNLFRRIFGDDEGAEARAEALIAGIRLETDDLKNSVGLVGTGIRDLFSGDIDTGLTNLKDGFSGIVDSVFDMADLFANRNMGDADPLGWQTMLPEDGVLDSGSSSPFADLRTTIETELEAIANGDFSAISTLLESNLGTAFTIALTAVGMLFGGPLGIAMGLGKLFIMAVEADFMGIGTALEESTVVQDIKDGFTGLFDSLFGAGDDSPELSDGYRTMMPFDEIQAIQDDVDNLEQPGKNPFSWILDSMGILGDLIDVSLIDSIDELGEGLAGFVLNVMDADWAGLGEAVMPWLVGITNLLAGIAGIVVVAGLGGISAILNGISDALPHLGNAFAAIIDGTGALLSGDFIGVVTAITDFVLAIGGAIVGFTVGAADGIINVIESLTGMEFVTVGEGLTTLKNQVTGLGDALIEALNIRVPVNRMTQLMDNVILRIQQARIAWLELRGQDSTDAIAAMEETAERIQNVGLGLDVNDTLMSQLNLGELDLSQALDITVNGETLSTTLGDALFNPEIVGTLGARAGTLMQDAWTLAAESGDFDAMTSLMNSAMANGLEIDQTAFYFESILNSNEFGQFDLTTLLYNLDGDGVDVMSLLSEQINSALETGDLELADGLIDAGALFGGEESITELATGINDEFLAAFADLSTDSLIEEMGFSEDDAIAIGENITAGLVTGISDGQSDVTDETQTMVDELQTTIEDGFQINSPSLYMQEIGGHLMSGLQLGMDTGMLGIDPIMKRINEQTGLIGTTMTGVGLQWHMMTKYMGSAIAVLETQVRNFIPQVQALQQMIASMGAIPVLYVSTSPPSGGDGVAGAFAEGGHGEAGAIYKVAEPSIGGIELIRSDAGGSYIVSSSGFDAIPPMPFDTSSMIPPAPVNNSTSSGNTTNYHQTVNATINVPEGTAEVTPEIISEGIQQGLRDNPVRREHRNDL